MHEKTMCYAFTFPIPSFVSFQQHFQSVCVSKIIVSNVRAVIATIRPDGVSALPFGI